MSSAAFGHGPDRIRLGDLEDHWAARTLQLTPDEVAAIAAG